MPTFQLELERWHWNVGYSISGTFSEERSKDNAKEGLYDSDEIRTRAGNPSRFGTEPKRDAVTTWLHCLDQLPFSVNITVLLSITDPACVLRSSYRYM